MRSSVLLALLIGLGSGCINGVAAQRMPRFDFSPNHKVLLFWSDTWEAGSSSVLSILTKDKIIYINVSVSGVFGSPLKTILMYECPLDGRSEEVDLSTQLTGSSVVRCPGSIPFTVQSSVTVEGKFELKMGVSSIKYDEVANRNVKLRVRVEWAGGSIQSNPLFLYNLDPLSLFNAGSIGALQRKFLTPAAIELMTKLNYSQDGPFPSVLFIEPTVSQIVKSSPRFFKSKITMGAKLYFNAGSCLYSPPGEAILFVSYYSKFDFRLQNLQKLMHLDIESGYFEFSASGLKHEIALLYNKAKPQSTIGICTLMSLSGKSEPYDSIQAVDERFPVDHVKYPAYSMHLRRCEVARNANGNVTIISGMDTTALVCPILCDDKSQAYRFFRGDNLLLASEEWTLIKGIRVYKTGNIIEFTTSVSDEHSGPYRCEAGSKSFQFNVTVISMPQFTTNASSMSGSSSGSAASGLLPEKVFAMEGESLIYNCTARFGGLSSVTVSPMFYMHLPSGSRTNWAGLTSEEFRQKLLATDKWMSITTTTAGPQKTLSVNVVRVPPVNLSLHTNFSHRFVCNASVDSVESALVGMSEYRTQTGTDVIFLKRLTRESFVINPNNNCSVQNCGVINGASFKFSLSKDTAAYLRDLGVEISAYFMLDDLLLTDVKPLFVDYASMFHFDTKSATLSYQIRPISSQSVLDELQKRKNLTAVFKLSYPNSKVMSNLQHNKSAYGIPSIAAGTMDCRSDPFCFYSTEFDLASGLDFLRVGLNFLVVPLPSKETGLAMGTIAGVAIAAAVAVLVALVAVYIMTRSLERAYLVEENELRVGHNPRAEAREEAFKDYIRAGAADVEDAPALVVA